MAHFLNETFIVAIAFFALIPFVYKPIKKSILFMLDKKTAAAIKTLNEAQELYNKAQELLKEAQKHHATAIKDAQDIIKKANDEAEIILKEANDEVEKIVKKRTALSIARINQQEKQIIDDIKNSAIQLAVSQVQESIVNELGKEAQLSLIENGIKEAKKLLN